MTSGGRSNEPEAPARGLSIPRWRFGLRGGRRRRSTMIQCPTCKQLLESGVRFCPHDGTPLSETAATQNVKTPTARPGAPDIPLPVVVGGRYRLEEKRGGGGMAKVYRATDQTLERPVAVKLMNPELRSEP